jgi:hypothetical protein
MKLNTTQAAEILGWEVNRLQQHIHRKSALGRVFVKEGQIWLVKSKKALMDGYEAWKPKPGKYGDGSRKIGFRVDEEQDRIISKLADKYDLSVTEWCRIRSLTDGEYEK